MSARRTETLRLAGALALPFLATAIQLIIWPWVTPFIWILFFAAVFFSSWLAGRKGGLPATVLSVILVVYFFMEPRFSFRVAHPENLWSVAVFVIMGVLFSEVHERLRQAVARTATALAESEDKFKAIVEQQLAGVAIIQNDCLRYASPRFAEMFGFSRAEDIVDHLDLAHLAAEKGREEFLGMVEEALDDAASPSHKIFAAVRRNGSTFACQIYIRRFEYEGALALIGMFVDVTSAEAQRERFREQAAEVRELNATLEQRVAFRTAEVTAANAELESFAYAVSHDLRAPLRAMSGFARAIAEDGADGLDEKSRRYLDRITSASASMTELIDGLLALSRATQGGLHVSDVDLSALTASFSEELCTEDPDHRVIWHIEPGIVVKGDAVMLETALRNLLGNACKYTSKCEGATIELSTCRDEQGRWICVRDNGAGFDPAYVARLFQPFQRLHTQDEFEGIGIGLATVQRIINRHGGVVRAEGSPGKGASFCFLLPEDRPDARVECTFTDSQESAPA